MIEITVINAIVPDWKLGMDRESKVRFMEEKLFLQEIYLKFFYIS